MALINMMMLLLKMTKRLANSLPHFTHQRRSWRSYSDVGQLIVQQAVLSFQVLDHSCQLAVGRMGQEQEEWPKLSQHGD